MAHSYSENVQVSHTIEKAKVVAQEALMKAGFGMSRWVEQQQALYAEGSINLWSWGEDILIRFQENEEGTLIQFTSSCKMSTQIIDWGKNKKNAKKFLASLHSL